MIVLDEQLMGRGLDREIAAWYRGAVRYLIDLRPNSVIKDEAIPTLLRSQPQPTFVTINERDFWERVVADPRYCIVCFSLPDSRADEIPRLLRALLRRPEFNTKARRMGKIIRISSGVVSYYAEDDPAVKSVV
jgi:hypothetical protein